MAEKGKQCERNREGVHTHRVKGWAGWWDAMTTTQKILWKEKIHKNRALSDDRTDRFAHFIRQWSFCVSSTEWEKLTMSIFYHNSHSSSPSKDVCAPSARRLVVFFHFYSHQLSAIEPAATVATTRATFQKSFFRELTTLLTNCWSICVKSWVIYSQFAWFTSK